MPKKAKKTALKAKITVKSSKTPKHVHTFLIITVLLLTALLVVAILLKFSVIMVPPEVVPAGGFCGSSTNAACSADKDCAPGGCSGQICRGTAETSGVTTCEWTDCYNSGKYNLTCGCSESKCAWK